MLRTLTCGVLLLSGCRQDMYNQPKVKAYSKSEFFPDGSSARPLPEHTVQYHDADENETLYTGLSNEGMLLAQLPAPLTLTPELLSRGRERYDIYCAVCHGLNGNGHGQVVQQGFPPPPSYQTDRLRQAPLGHFYDVITSGYGAMYSYAQRVEPHDRWAIAAYVRALQLSQQQKKAGLPPNEQKLLEVAP